MTGRGGAVGKRSFSDRVRAWRDRIPPASWCRMVNALNSIRGKKHRISPVEGERILLARDGAAWIHFCRRRRGGRYRHGIAQRVNRLAGDYLLDSIHVAPGGLFIDCGANIGELGFWARAKGLGYIAFEPEALEARCCDLNNFDGRPETRRVALWKDARTLDFYSKPDSADSSIFDPGSHFVRTEVPATTLDGAVAPSEVTGTVILKVEAEGAEPEILEGATDLLPRVHWAAVDCGHERGIARAHTFVETNVLLQDAGFVLHRVQFDRIVGLYRNTRHRDPTPRNPGSAVRTANRTSRFSDA